jgi:uncharacterized membrane protein YdbT with pleckstrin-like domain
MLNEKIVLRPKFILSQCIAEKLGVYGLVLLIFLFPHLMVFLDDTVPPSEVNHSLDMMKMTAAMFIAFIVFLISAKFFSYRRTSYHFLDDMVIYKEGFLTLERKEVHYDKILEVIFRQNILQKLNGLGTIVLSTAASQGQSVSMFSTAGSRSGVVIADVEQPEEQYEKKNL